MKKKLNHKLKIIRKRIKQVGFFNTLRLARRKDNKHINVTPKVIGYIDSHTTKTFDENLINLWRASEDFPQSNMQIDLTEAAFLRFLVRLSNAKKILEIGTFRGWSTAILVSALMQNEINVLGAPSNGRIVTLERDPEQAGTAKTLWAKYLDPITLSRIDLRLGDAKDELQHFATAKTVFDIIFIDADKGGYPFYLSMAQKLIAPGGLIILDNMLNAGLVAHGAGDRVTTSIRTTADLAFGEEIMLEGFEPVFLPAWDGVVILHKV